METSKPHRKLLMISCAFPPTGGPGVQRSTKFAKYLPQFGWKPIVWAAEPLPGFPTDATLLDDLPPEVEIHRLPAQNTARTAAKWLEKTARGTGLLARCAAAAEWRVRLLANRIGAIGEYEEWARASLPRLHRMVKLGGIDAVYSTYSPPSNHWLGLMLKGAFALPWVADFRDLWTEDPRYAERPRRFRMHRRLEQTIVEEADLVVGVTPSQTEILASRVPSDPRKFVTITNGFDSSDFEALLARPHRSDHFVVAHVGRLTQWRMDNQFFPAFEEFLRILGPDRARVRLRIVGAAAADRCADIAACGVECEYTGYLPHDEAVGEMRSADLLLLLGETAQPIAPTFAGGKIFEYLASGRPILHVGPPDGEAARIVRTCEAGISVGPDHLHILSALQSVFHRWKSGNPLPGCEESRMKPYSRRELTRRLAECLDGLVRDGADGRQRPGVVVDASGS